MKGIRPYTLKKIGLTLLQVSILAGTMSLGGSSSFAKKGISSYKMTNQPVQNQEEGESIVPFVLFSQDGVRPATLIIEITPLVTGTRGLKYFQYLLRFSGLSPPSLS